MFYIMLTILKIIGLIIAILLMILLLFLLSVLFIPLRYKVKFNIHEGMHGKVMITWITYAARVHLNYENNEISYYIRLLGFKIIDSKRTKEDHAEQIDEKSSEIEETNQTVRIQQVECNPKKVPEHLPNKPPADNRVTETESSDEKISMDQGKRKKKFPSKNLFNRIYLVIKSILNSIKKILLKIQSFVIRIFHSIIHIFQGTINLIETIENKIEYFNENINTEENKKLLKFLFDQLKALLHHIRPAKNKLRFKIGFTEPDLLGKVLGYAAMANTFLNLNLSIEPVYEKPVLEGEIYLKGRIRVFSVGLIVFRVYREKQFKKLLKMLK